MATKKGKAAPAQLQRDEVGEYRVIPIEYVGTEDFPLMFTDNITVMHTEEHFVVGFYQNQQPLILQAEDAMKVESVKSKCVGRFVMTPNQMRNFMAALETNLTKFNERVELIKKGGEE